MQGQQQRRGLGGLRGRGRARLLRVVLAGAMAMLAGPVAKGATAAEEAPTCTAPAVGEPIFITEECVDPRFNDGYAFIDVDEVRQAPVPHRFVYGGFRGTDARFALYFPAADQYEGRFIQGPVHQLRLTGEVASKEEIEFAFDSGAYLVETNNGGTDVCLTARDGARGKCDPTIVGYRANAAAAKFSRVVARQVYGTSDRPYGYIYGGSGGAYMSLASAKETRGVWDGFLPFVMGDPQALVAHFALRAHALRVLGDKLADVVDAMDAGGSGDPYATLNRQQADVLREITRFGFPLRAWFDYPSLNDPFLSLITSDYVKLLDPTYVNDFWTKPGYLGTERSAAGAAIRAARIQHPAKIVAAAPSAPAPVPAPPAPPYDVTGPAYPYLMVAQYLKSQPAKALVLDGLPAGDLGGAQLVLTSGPARGQSCPLSVIDRERNVVECGANSDPAVINAIGTGDTVRIDNSFYLAFQTQPRHELAPAGFGVYSYDQYRNKNGSPRYPQRPVSPGLFGTRAGAGSVADGTFHGKMIVVNTMLDREAYAFPADWYRQKVLEQVGARRLDEKFRVYFTDNAVHGGVPDATRTVDYGPVLQQALRDLAAWVEKGTAPPPSTSYTVDKNSQIQLPSTAAQRRGLQPVVHLRANGAVRVDVKAGHTVTFEATIETPPGTGKVICVDWDLEGTGRFGGTSPTSGLSPVTDADPTGQLNQPLGGSSSCDIEPAEKVTTAMSHTYADPGTYFAVVRGTSQRVGDSSTPYTKIQNLARVRVVVR